MDRREESQWTWGTPRSVDLNVLAEGTSRFKSYFPIVARLLREVLESQPDARLLDIGCSDGAFIEYLRESWTNLECVGLDLLAPLVEAARLNVPGAEFVVGDLLEPATLPTGFDVTTMLGIHSLFDDPGCWLDSALATVRRGGRLFAFGLFNTEPVDVLVRMRDSRSPSDPGPWQSGWTMWSRRTVEYELRLRGLTWSWHEYDADQPTARWSDDPLHSWTVNVDGLPMSVNGGQLLHSQATLEVVPA